MRRHGRIHIRLGRQGGTADPLASVASYRGTATFIQSDAIGRVSFNETIVGRPTGRGAYAWTAFVPRRLPILTGRFANRFTHG